jgi:hypothetical protein
MTNHYDWLDLVDFASEEEKGSLLRLYEVVSCRHPGLTAEEILEYATDSEVEAIKRIRKRVEDRPQETVRAAPL